jgi:hypothetical protein
MSPEYMFHDCTTVNAGVGTLAGVGRSRTGARGFVGRAGPWTRGDSRTGSGRKCQKTGAALSVVVFSAPG